MRGKFHLLQGDCMELLKSVPRDSVDLVLCDLPYGTTQNAWDSVLPLAELWQEYRRVCRGAVVLTAAQPFTSALIQSNLRDFKYCWIWDKVNRPTGHLNSKKQPLRITEDVCVFYRRQPKYNPQMTQGVPYRSVSGKSASSANYGQQEYGVVTENNGTRYPRNLLRIAVSRKEEGRVHPNQKPVALMEYFIKTYSNAGDVVLDNCMGSGTTGVAAVSLGRFFIGMERNPDYFSVAQQRIQESR